MMNYSIATIEEPEYIPPLDLTDEQYRVVLERKWALAYGLPIPSTTQELEAVVPPVLRDPSEKREQWLRGSFHEAQMAFIRTFNESRHMRDFEEKVKQAGVEHALCLFEPEVRTRLDEVIALHAP